MASDPQYVRLAPGRDRGMMQDFTHNSGWGISGKDVKPFPPENKKARRFVREALHRGTLVPAGLAEYEEAKAGDEPLPAAEEIPHQEHKVSDGFLGQPAMVADEPPSEPDGDSEPAGASDDEPKSKKGKGKSKKKGKAKKSDGGELLTAEDLEGLGAEELKRLLKDNGITLDGRFSKKAAADALLAGKAVKK